MILAELISLRTGERVRRLEQDFIVVHRTGTHTCLIDDATMNYTVHLSYSDPRTLSWIRHLYRSHLDTTPRGDGEHPYIVIRQTIEIGPAKDPPRLLDANEALKTATSYADWQLPGAVITDWYEHTRLGVTRWRVHLAQVIHPPHHNGQVIMPTPDLDIAVQPGFAETTA